MPVAPANVNPYDCITTPAGMNGFAIGLVTNDPASQTFWEYPFLSQPLAPGYKIVNNAPWTPTPGNDALQAGADFGQVFFDCGGVDGGEVVTGFFIAAVFDDFIVLESLEFFDVPKVWGEIDDQITVDPVLLAIKPASAQP